MRVSSKPASIAATNAKVSTTALACITQSYICTYQRLTQTISAISFSCTRPVTSIATAAGTKVTDKIIAPSSAATTVKAIGWNIFPSTPEREKIGRYTTMMMN